jgi:hypothetical protein
MRPANAASGASKSCDIIKARNRHIASKHTQTFINKRIHTILNKKLTEVNMLKLLLTFSLIFVFCAVGLAQTGESNKKILFKADTEFSAEIEKGLDAEEAKIGEDINFKLTEDFKGENDTIYKNSELYGRIVNIQKASDDNKKTSLISVMFDFVKKGDDFVPLTANIVAVDKSDGEIKFEPSPTYDGGTILSMKGKNIKIDKGAVFRIKLAKDITEK